MIDTDAIKKRLEKWREHNQYLSEHGEMDSYGGYEAVELGITLLAEIERIRDGLEALMVPGHRYMVEVDGAPPIGVLLSEDVRALLKGGDDG